MINDIRKSLIRNSLTTYACVFVTCVAMVLYFMSANKAVDESRKYLYMIKESGEVVPMEWVNRRDNVEIEMKHHLQMLVDDFYSLNQFNWEEKAINKAFWLGDMEKIHIDRENKGYYNRFIQYNVVQEAELHPEDIELVRSTENSYSFKIIIHLSESYLEAKNEYLVFARGKIKITDRNFPHNPHGMFVEEYVEDRLEKLEK